jgi:hypothetical protein
MFFFSVICKYFLLICLITYIFVCVIQLFGELCQFICAIFLYVFVYIYGWYMGWSPKIENLFKKYIYLEPVI